MSKEQFLTDYFVLEHTVLLKTYTELNDIERLSITKLYDRARQLYQSIVRNRTIGSHYVYAALSYFAISDDYRPVTEDAYLVLRISYFFYQQHQEIAQLANSKNKQKEILDLLRYITKPLFDKKVIESELEETKKLMQFYLDFMLNDQHRDAQEKYQVWIKEIENTQIKGQKNLIHLHRLTILFKRLAQKKLVLRPRKKKKSVKDWPSQNQLARYKERKKDQRVYLDDATDIRVTHDVIYDEDGDLTVEETGLIIHSTDLRTARFHTILTAHSQNLFRHRQRRLQPFVTNQYYMSRSVIRQLVYLLNLEFDHAYPTEAAIAAACLLSLSSGLSPVALLQYSQLIKDGILLINHDSKHPEYRICLKLEITEQKIEYLKVHQLNHTRTHELYLSSSWFDYLQHRDQEMIITVGEINRYLKKWTGKSYLGSITIEKLQAQLYFHVFHHTFNEYIAHVLSGKDSHHDLPSSFYNGVRQQKLNEQYLIYLETLRDPDLDQTISHIQRQFQTLKRMQSLRLGSQLALTPEFVSDFFKKLHHICSEQIHIDQHVIQQLNAYAVWMWHVSLLCLTGRPKENLLGQIDDYDLKMKLLYVNDKKNSQSRKDGRFIPLPKFFIHAFERYVAFLTQITQRYQHLLKWVFNKTISMDDLFGQIIIYPKQLPTTAQHWCSKRIKISPLSRSWIKNYLEPYFDAEIYNNWLRHFDMNMLMDQDIPFNLIQALYGHDQRNQELFYRYSSATMCEYVSSITKGIDQMVNVLQIKQIS